MVALDAAFRYVYVTDEAAAVLDTTPDALLGRVIWDAYPAVGPSPIGALIRDVMRHRSESEIRTPAVDREGADVIVRVAPTPDGGVRMAFRVVTRASVSPAVTLTGTH